MDVATIERLSKDCLESDVARKVWQHTRHMDMMEGHDKRVAALLGAGVFAVYAAGASPTIYVGDSGELVTAVYLLGIPHPTGYPLYVLLGKLWTLLLPFGSIAWRMSLFSAACGAGASAMLYLLSRRAARVQPVAALFAALLLAFGPSFWSQANIPRVYALNALFVVLALWAAWRWYEERTARRLAFTFFLCGLGATNHTFLGVQAVAFGLFAVWVEPSLFRRPLEILGAGAATLFGLLPYAYLPLRSRANPRLDWGNPETLDGFLDSVLRRDFWGRAWIEGPSDWITIVGDWAGSLFVESAWVGPALAVLAIVAARGRGWPVLLLGLVMFGNVLSLGLHGSRSDIFIWHRYYIPSYLTIALLSGLGCQLVIERLPRQLRMLPLVIPAFLLVSGWSAYDRSNFRVADAFASEVLRSIPPGAHLSASDDNILFSLLYLHFVEGRRPDLDLVALADGAEENWRYFDGPTWEHATKIVDHGHACQHLKKGLVAYYGAESVKGRAEYERLKIILKDEYGGVDEVITELRRLERKLRDKKRTHKKRGEILRKERKYFDNQRERMDYGPA